MDLVAQTVRNINDGNDTHALARKQHSATLARQELGARVSSQTRCTPRSKANNDVSIRETQLVRAKKIVEGVGGDPSWRFTERTPSTSTRLTNRRPASPPPAPKPPRAPPGRAAAEHGLHDVRLRRLVPDPGALAGVAAGPLEAAHVVAERLALGAAKGRAVRARRAVRRLPVHEPLDVGALVRVRAVVRLARLDGARPPAGRARGRGHARLVEVLRCEWSVEGVKWRRGGTEGKGGARAASRRDGSCCCT